MLHAARGNFDITVLVHDNRVYGLTTGQASPTAQKGFPSKSTPRGIIESPLNPLALAITAGASFVAQSFAGDLPHLADLLVEAIRHKGFSLVNVLQPCVTFNRVNTYEWYRNRVYKLKKEERKSDKLEALKLAIEQKRLPLGILYQKISKTYEESLPQLAAEPLVKKSLSVDWKKLLSEFA